MDRVTLLYFCQALPSGTFVRINDADELERTVKALRIELERA